MPSARRAQQLQARLVPAAGAPGQAAPARFLDESGINLALTRLYGRAPRGERVSEQVPRNYGAHTSVISTLGLSGPEAVWAVEGAVGTDVFNAYVERVLRPTIRRGDILALDNLRAHHAGRIEEVAADCGAEVIWLAPYSTLHSLRILALSSCLVMAVGPPGQTAFRP